MLSKLKINSLFLLKKHYGTENILFDKHNRFHDYLRISLTERCNLRCMYCMPEEGVNLSPKSQILTADEIFRLSKAFVGLGVKTIRLTGGEPLVRKDLVDITGRINTLKESGLQKIYLTTNGITLSSKIDSLVKAGLNGVNISLDTLKSPKFELITRRKGFDKVWKSIQDCLHSGIELVKVNCVVIRGVNDDELIDFVRLTENMPLDIRFIEYMPFGGNKWELKKMVSYNEMLSRIKDNNLKLIPVDNGSNSTSKMYQVENWKGRVGFITSNTLDFCGTCNRLRITADGNLKACLHGLGEISLRDAMRSGKSDDDLGMIISDEIKKKKPKHAATLDHLSHIDRSGALNMVDISDKTPSVREASVSCYVHMKNETLVKIKQNLMKKGDVLTVAKIAGIMAAKKTHELIPLCHQVQLSKVDVSCSLQEDGVLVSCKVKTSNERTGVEMEAMVGSSIAAITIYDMCKAVDRSIVISDLKLDYKIGGKSDYGVDVN